MLVVNYRAAERIAHALARHHGMRDGYENSPAWELYMRWGQVAAESIDDMIREARNG